MCYRRRRNLTVCAKASFLHFLPERNPLLLAPYLACCCCGLEQRVTFPSSCYHLPCFWGVSSKLFANHLSRMPCHDSSAVRGLAVCPTFLLTNLRQPNNAHPPASSCTPRYLAVSVALVRPCPAPQLASLPHPRSIAPAPPPLPWLPNTTNCLIRRTCRSKPRFPKPSTG